MNCEKVIRILPAVLAGERSDYERGLVEDHLAACVSCRNERDDLLALQDQIRADLHHQASQAAPSPQAWSRLQVRLDASAHGREPARPQSWLNVRLLRINPGISDMKRIAYVALVLLALFAGTVAAVPGVRAAVLENLIGWLGYDFPSPTGSTLLSLATNWGFSPFNPRYVPGGLEIKGTMTAGDPAVDTLGLCYQPEHREQGDPFVVVVQTKLAAARDLPAGKQVSVGDAAGSLDEMPAGEIEWCLGPSPEEILVPVPEGQEPNAQEELPPDEPLRYDHALRLTYFQGDIQIEIFGSLAEEELLRIARSMEQAGLAAEQPAPPATGP